MSVPNTMLLGNLTGLVVLESRPLRTDSEGITRATVRYACYPPDATLRPARGSSHPRYGALKLETCDVRVDGFMFFDATYVGLLDGPQIAQEAESHVRTGWWLSTNQDGSMSYKQYAIKNTVARTRGVTTGDAPTAAEGEAVSYSTDLGITRYVVETMTETRTEVP